MSQNPAPELTAAPLAGEFASEEHVETPAADVAAPGDSVAATPPAPESQPESRAARGIRMAHRARLHIYALAAVLVLVYVVALATTNTRRVRVDWVFAHSSVQLVWLTLFAAILGWLLGTLVTILFRRRTRRPRQG
jgi:uncharacterized integral membrane protein